MHYKGALVNNHSIFVSQREIDGTLEDIVGNGWKCICKLQLICSLRMLYDINRQWKSYIAVVKSELYT